MTEQNEYRIGQRIAAGSIAVSTFLASLKIVTGFIAGSTALTADGFESAGDILTSAIVLGGMTIARRPADERFPYGYGRAESLAAKTVSTVLLVSAVLLATHSIRMLMVPREALPSWAIIPLGISFAAKSILAAYKYRIGKRVGSSALVADAANDTLDVLSATVAATAIGLSLWRPESFSQADPIGGFCVAMIIFFLGMRVFRDSSSELMDVMPDPRLVAQVREIAEKVPGVCAVEKCYGRKSGVQYFFDLHVEVDPQMTVLESHGLSHEVKNAILEGCAHVRDVLVHVEPHARGRNTDPGR